MSEEHGESVEAADDPGDGVDDASADAGSRRESSAEDAADDGDAPSIDLDELEDLVEAHEPEAVARELAGFRERVHELERELDAERTEREDLESRLKRKQAEFQNYKKRQSRRREKERARATEDLVERLLEVRDNLSRALEQDDDADIREGVEATFRQLDDVLRSEDVDPIEPEPGAEVDPQRHEVLLTIDGDQPPGTVEEVHRPGYEMADKVLRTAQVTVADGEASADDDTASDGGARGGDEASGDPDGPDTDGSAGGPDGTGAADAGSDGTGAADAGSDGTDDAGGAGTDDAGGTRE